MSEDKKIPTTIFTGFLGSGKTTIISHLIEHLQQEGQQVVFIKNEVGNEDLDSKLMKGKNIETRELLNGCICCTLVGPLNNAIDELIATFHPDRIIIESAGTADPSSIALTISNHCQLIRDGLIAIIDVVNFNGYEDLNQITRRQAMFVDLIVFNKVELVDDKRKEAVVGYVREFNEYSPIVESPQGKLDPRLAFGIKTPDKIEKLFQQEKPHKHDHLHNDDISAYTYVSDRPFDRSSLEETLQNLPKNVFRIKGVVKLADNQFKVINGVFKRFDWLELPIQVEITQTRLIMIGYHLNSNKDTLIELLKKCEQ